MKKKLLLTGATILTLGTIGSTMVIKYSKPAEAGTSPLVTQVDNHEARIKNLESNVSAIQTRTGTPPSSNQVDVPVVNSTSPTPTDSTSSPSTDTAPVESAPVVTAYKEIVIDADNSDCEYTYSDGTTKVFHWKTTNPKGAWVTDSSGQNGHWVKTTSQNGFCDQRAIGQSKN
jgi:hypothetical protein